ncbi:hypothetical protein QL285_065508 [Trifolium repens]|nr:hypothetical protein QL285_065508 [Trifolium repens]
MVVGGVMRVPFLLHTICFYSVFRHRLGSPAPAVFGSGFYSSVLCDSHRLPTVSCCSAGFCCFRRWFFVRRRRFLPLATLLFCGFSSSGVGLDLVRFWLIWFRWVVGGAAGMFLVSGVDLSQRRR